MENKDALFLLGMLAAALIFYATALMANEKPVCQAKAEKVLIACQAELGKVFICDDAFDRALFVCNHRS